jgi:pimeloyl-ACP methyl ester carboxylesterase
MSLDQLDLDRRYGVDDVELAWDSWNNESRATPLFLCHGFSGSAHDFAMHVASLAGDRRVVASDHRGHGLSTKLHRVDGYSLDRLAHDLIALLDAEMGGPVHLLGHSMGGNIALRVTLARPDLVRSLVLMDTSASSFRPLDPAIFEMYTNFIEKFDPTRGLAELAQPPSPEDALIEQHTTIAWRERKAILQGDFDPYAFKALATQLFAANDLSVSARLEEISCPTTVLVGSLDHPLIDTAPDLTGAIAGARLDVIDGAYHSPQLTHPQRWHDAVNTHLATAE